MITKDIENMIAGAIKGADNKLFNEDYGLQANAVMATLREKGFIIVPRKPSEKAITETIEGMPYGRMKPEDYLREIYALMLINALRYHEK